VRCIFEINVGLGLLSTDNQYLLGWGDGSKVDRNGRRSDRPPQGFDAMTPLSAEYVVHHAANDDSQFRIVRLIDCIDFREWREWRVTVTTESSINTCVQTAR